MRRARAKATVVLAVLMAALPAAADEQPPWLVDPAAAYPPADYLVGLGSGDTDALAVESARADLAAAFRARVRSTQTSRDRVDESFGDKGNGFSRTSSLDRATIVEASAELANAVVGGTWYDETAGRHHALVYVERAEAARTLRADLAACQGSIRELLDCGGCYADAVADYAASRQGLGHVARWRQLADQLLVVDGTVPPRPDGIFAQVEAWYARASEALTLRVASSPPELAATLRDVLVEAGFNVVNGDALYVADLAYATDAAPPSPRFVFENWSLDLRVRRVRDAAELANIERHDKAGHTSRDGARERCLREAREALREGVLAELRVIFFPARIATTSNEE